MDVVYYSLNNDYYSFVISVSTAVIIMHPKGSKNLVCYDNPYVMES